MHPAMALSLYKIAQKLRGEMVFSALAKLEETQWYSSQKLRNYQFILLRQILNHAYQNVTALREKYDAVGFHPNDLKSFNDLRLLPVMTKKELHARHDEFVAADRKYRYTCDSTSGSSGPATLVYTDRDAAAFEHSAFMRSLQWWNVQYGVKIAKFWGTQLDQKRIIKDKIRDISLNRITLSTNNINEKMLLRHYNRIIKFKPKVIHGFTSAIHEFAKFCKNYRISEFNFGVDLVITTGEVLHDFQKKDIEDIFGKVIMDEYGCAEVGPIAYTCPSGGRHLMSDYLIVETLSENNGYCDGSKGDVLITNLINKVMPLVRYKLNDVIALSDQACPCGRGLPLIKKIYGKTPDVIRTPEGNIVHGLSFDYLPKYFEGRIKRFFILQEKIDLLRVNILPDNGFTEHTKSEFSDKLRKLVGKEINIFFEVHENELPRERSGKQRLIISEIKEDRLS